MPEPIISVAEMRAWETESWAAGVAQLEVIANVGRLVAERARLMTRPGELIAVLAGKGHNGDDCRAAIPYMEEREVRLLNTQSPEQALLQLTSILRDRPALVIDGLLGIGLDRDLSSDWTALIQLINDSGRPVLSVDVPSGLDADTGLMRGAAIVADVTLTLGAVKRGLVRESAAPFVGRLEVARDIGLTPSHFDPELFWSDGLSFVGEPPRRSAQAHKGDFGHVVIVAGSLGYHGAAVLAARGASRARPGLVTVVTMPETFPAVASQLQSAMVQPWADSFTLPAKMTAMVWGPGFAAPTLPQGLREFLRRQWQKGAAPWVVDASSLDWVPPGPLVTSAARVITPHPGEASRMLQCSVDEVEADRPAAVRKLSARYGDCWVILKGRMTCLGRSHGKIYLNASGNAGMAQGGAGDLLAGYIGGVMAQSPYAENPLRGLLWAVWQHGAAADALENERSNWTIEELADRLGSVIVHG